MLNEYKLGMMLNTDDIFSVFTHLSKEDKNFVYRHIEEILRKVSSNKKVSFANDNNQTYLTFDYSSDLLLRYMKSVTKEEYNTFSEYLIETENDIFVGYDYIAMRDACKRFIPDFTSEYLLKAIAMIEFRGDISFIDIINAVGTILERYRIYDMNILYQIIRTPCELVKKYVQMKEFVVDGEDLISNHVFGIFDNYKGLAELQYLMDGELSTEGLAHLVHAIYDIVEIYSVARYPMDSNNALQDIYNGYFMKCLVDMYKDEEKILNILTDILDKFRGNFSELSDNLYSNLQLSREICQREIGDLQEPEIQLKENANPVIPGYTPDIHKSLSGITKEKIVNVIHDKINLSEDSIEVSFDIPEELLAMYLSEYHVTNPIFNPIYSYPQKFYIRYDGKFYVLFDLKEPNILYGIREIPEENEYELLEIRKSSNIKYVYRY